MNWKKLLESSAESANDELRLRNAYLVAENRILRIQINGQVQLTDSERKELAEIGAKLGKQALAEIATVAQADTILAWHRKFANQKVNASALPKSVGRPRVAQEIKEWVIRMARENRSWGYDRIQGALNHLGYTISDQTVDNILKRHGISPAPERKTTVTWREFVRCHWNMLLATDFFNSDVWSWLGFLISYLRCVLHFSCHQVHTVEMALLRHVEALRPFIMQALTLVAPVQSWLQSAQLHTGGPGPAAFEFVISDCQKPSCQDIGKVRSLPRIKPGRIRDGPRRYQSRLNKQWNDDDHQEAA